MSVKLSNEKNDLIRSIAQSQGFQNYQLQVTSGSMKGDGYLGIINTLKIQDEKSDKQLNLIMKSAMTADKLRENTPVRKAYEREIYLYETIFPEFKKLSQERNITHRFSETAKNFGSLLTEKEECLVLENLKEIQFKLWDRKKAMDEDHVALVFRTYGKFHASGLALRKLKPDIFEEMGPKLKNIFIKDDESDENKKKMETSMKQVFENGFKAVAGDEKATQGLLKFTQNFQKFFLEDLLEVNRFSTILHGDCWCNNMMFKYDDLDNPSKPTDMVLLDWQISQIGSPIQDLSYFLYACGSKEVIYKLPKLLKIYHESLSTTLSEAGLDPEEILSFEDLEGQWKKYCKFGMFMTLFAMRIILSEVEEAPDLSQLAEEGKNILESVLNVEQSVNMDDINRRIRDVVIFMVENDFL